MREAGKPAAEAADLLDDPILAAELQKSQGPTLKKWANYCAYKYKEHDREWSKDLPIDVSPTSNLDLFIAFGQALGDCVVTGDKENGPYEVTFWYRDRFNMDWASPWTKEFFENGAAAFAKTASSRATSQSEQRITKLEDKLKRKDEVIAEIMAEHILLKKELGES